MKSSIFQLIKFGKRRLYRLHSQTFSLARVGTEEIPLMTTRQLLLILHRCKELRLDNVNRWPQFLYGKNLEELNRVEALRLLRYLSLHIEFEQKGAPYVR